MPQLYVTMPQPGETITQGTIVSWIAKPGDVVAEGQAIAELETEKAVFEYESPFEGTLVSLMHDAGAQVPVAQPIAIMDVDEAKAKTYVMMGIGKYVDDSQAPASAPVAQAKKAAQQKPAAKAASATPSAPVTNIKMSPYVRRLVKERGLSAVDLSQLASANDEGRITKQAIEAYSGSGSAAPVLQPQRSSSQGYEAITCSPIRMRIAQNMVLSKQKIPHAHNGIAVDITHVVAFRDEHKKAYKAKHGINLNFLSLISPALIKALKAYPIINASYVDTVEPHEIRQFHSINLGVACGTEHGLMIPVVKDIASLDVVTLNSQLGDVVSRAQNKKLMPQDMEGATLIFNNYGFFGTQLGVQVIQYPLAATLGMSAIEKRVVPVGDAIGVRTMTDFVLSFDHRVMDGRETGLFLAELKKQVEALDLSAVRL